MGAGSSTSTAEIRTAFPLLACSTMPAKACKRWPPLIGVGAVAALAVFMAFWHWTWSASSSGGAPMERALSAILLIVKARPLCGATGPMGRRGHQSPCEPDGLEVGQAPPGPAKLAFVK